jgi:hypothetical protein
LAPSYFTELVSLQIPRRSGIQSETDALKLIVVPSARKKSVVGVLCELCTSNSERPPPLCKVYLYVFLFSSTTQYNLY